MKEKKKKGENVFPGLGPKLASLLSLFYEELGLMPHLKGTFPVDVHIMSQCIGTGIISFSNGYVNASALAEIIRKQMTELCYCSAIKTTLNISHAMWFLGNELCYKYCGRKIKGLPSLLCPIFDCCKGRPSTRIYRARGKWGREEKEKPLPLFEMAV